MSDQQNDTTGDVKNTPLITNTVKTKNPNMVAQGKRLAMISKQAKERKLREKIAKELEEERAQKEQEHDEADENSDDETQGSSTLKYVIPIGLAGGGVYLVYKHYGDTIKNVVKSKTSNTLPEKEPGVKHNFVSPD